VPPTPTVFDLPKGGAQDGHTSTTSPGEGPAGGVFFNTPSGGGNLLDSSPGEALWLAGVEAQEEELLARDESYFRLLSLDRAPTITETLARATHEFRRAENDLLDGGDNDLAFMLDRLDHKAIQMAESILDGDDLVAQFARFTPSVVAAPVPAKSAPPSASAPAQGAEPRTVPGATPAAEASLLWPLLLVPGSALLAALLWVVVRQSRRGNKE
jgi:hypothetical protein